MEPLRCDICGKQMRASDYEDFVLSKFLNKEVEPICRVCQKICDIPDI